MFVVEDGHLLFEWSKIGLLVRLEGKNLTLTNTLAYYIRVKIIAIKSKLFRPCVD
jgi:hypothetical protein